MKKILCFETDKCPFYEKYFEVMKGKVEKDLIFKDENGYSCVAIEEGMMHSQELQEPFCPILESFNNSFRIEKILYKIVNKNVKINQKLISELLENEKTK